MEHREIQVLLVEDSPEERRLVGLELSEINEPQFRTTEASRLSDAEDELRKGRTDVVLLDLSLPDSVGLTGLSRLCQEFPTLPVVVFTGLDDQKMALQALREGGQDFLVKGQTEPGVLKRVLTHAIERKRVDVALSNSRESLYEAQRLETLGRLAGKIAHDFNNILTTIVGFSDLLLEDLEGHSAVDDIMEIKKAGERGAALTSSILSFSRREQPALEALCINDVIRGLSGMLSQLLPKGIELDLDLESGLPKAVGDLGQVEQALVNLVVNARDALPQGGRIKVKTGLRKVNKRVPLSSPMPRPGDYVTITVEDDGAGIDGATLDRIFEPFFTTKPRGAGTGLGLSTVIAIMRGCNGGIEVDSTLGQGSAFTLHFPLLASVAAGLGTARLEPIHAAVAGLDIAPRAAERDRGIQLVPSNGSAAEGSPYEANAESKMSRGDLSNHLSHLYHVVSHDFHEPLRMVNSYLGLVKRRSRNHLEGEMLEFIDYAVDGSQRMQGMLDAVLRYSRYLKSPALYDDTSTAEVYERVARGLSDRKAVHWQGPQPTLQVSAEHFTVLLRELLNNGLKFAAAQHPRVVVACREEGDGWVFEITDNGKGLPEGEQGRCFRLFGRLHGREEVPGLGVGLALSQAIAEKYGASLTISNVPQGGAQVRLVWPGVAREAKAS